MKSFEITIRPYQDQDWPFVWAIIESVFRAGETYAFSPDITEEQAYHVWIEKPEITFVAVGEDSKILGTYYQYLRQLRRKNLHINRVNTTQRENLAKNLLN